MQRGLIAVALPDINNTGHANFIMPGLVYGAIPVRFPLETSIRGYNLYLNDVEQGFIAKLQFDNNFCRIDEEKDN